MSLGIGINGTEGIVLAAESRVTLSITDSSTKLTRYISFDNATKILSFRDPNNYIGVVTYGNATIGQRTAHSFLPEIENELLQKKGRLKVDEFSEYLSDFFIRQWKAIKSSEKTPDMTFIIAGFNENEAYGRIYQINIPSDPKPKEIYTMGTFGIIWGGQREIVDRLLQGYDNRLINIIQSDLKLNQSQITVLQQKLQSLQLPVPVNIMALQDCINLAILFIRTTIDTQQLTVDLRGCGGHIDIATITRDQGLKYIQKKMLIGEKHII